MFRNGLRQFPGFQQVLIDECLEAPALTFGLRIV